MSLKESKRRRIAASVFREAWRLNRKSQLIRMNFATSLKLAWRVVRSLARLSYSKAKGVSYGERQSILSRIAIADQDNIILSFLREPQNRFDSNAIAIVAEHRVSGQKALIGYVSKQLSSQLSKLIDEDKLLVIRDWSVTGMEERYLGLNFSYVVLG